jgi:murein DD-endopeptidase MepM/ murein hydrolase activator NlpD
LATLHHDVPPAARPLRNRRPRLRTYRRATLAAGLIIGTLLATPTALAAPGSVSDAQSAHDAVAGEVAAIEARVQGAQDTLQRMTVEAEAASGAALAAKAALDTAQAEAAATAAELATARGAVEQSQKQVSTLGRKAYMGSNDSFGDVALLLAAQGPDELLRRAATLDVLGQQRTEQLQQHQVAEDRQAQADQAAQAAVAERDQLARTAADAESAANAHLAAAQGDFDAATAEKATLDAQLREAEIQLLALQGAQNPAGAWATEQQATAAASAVSTTGGAVAPASGQVTSCYGSRWGTLHAGVDIAAPIGTPIYAPEGGTVVQAGPASGFGLAVAVQHADGTITLYGHVNQFFVSVGQAVSTGQQIAEIGNRGQSTGPHLHFEVHTGGLYVNRVDPMPWLTARGINIGGGC